VCLWHTLFLRNGFRLLISPETQAREVSFLFWLGCGNRLRSVFCFVFFKTTNDTSQTFCALKAYASFVSWHKPQATQDTRQISCADEFKQERNALWDSNHLLIYNTRHKLNVLHVQTFMLHKSHASSLQSSVLQAQASDKLNKTSSLYTRHVLGIVHFRISTLFFAPLNNHALLGYE